MWQVQVGSDSKALPIGLQLIGCPREEVTLLHVATAFEVQFA
jgi:Asp-tRNA(Asn)/Glu-tRNA(Gln) amidotransferase A subunit family amidase